MSKTKKTIFIVLSFVIAALVGSVLYAEKLSHENTKKELQEIVLRDIQQTEVFLEQNPDSMEQWADYLAINEAKNAINDPSEDSTNALTSLMMALKFTNGVTKYPVFVNLRDSLGALLDWRKSNFLQTAFRNQKILATLASSRMPSTGIGTGNSLMKTTPELEHGQKINLEKEFQDRMQGNLPCALPEPPFSENVQEKGALSKQEASPDLEPSVSEKAPKHRRSRLYNKLQKTHEEDENTEASPGTEKTKKQPQAQNSAAPSKPFILAETPSLTEMMTQDEKLRAKPFVNVSFQSGQMPLKLHNAEQKQLAIAPENLIQGEKTSGEAPASKACEIKTSETDLEVPELETNTDSSNDSPEFTPGAAENEDLQSFLSDSIPEAESENIKPEEQEHPSAGKAFPKKETSSAAPLKPFTNRIPALPSLHYSLKETVGNAPEAPEFEGPQTIEELQKNLAGDFSKDLEAVRKCWLMEEFRVPSDEDLATAYEKVQNAFNRFSTTLGRLNEKKRQGWIERLHLDALDLSQDPQLDVLQDVFRQLSNGNIGLELSVFVNFRESIKHYLTLVSIKNDPDQAKEMFKQARNRVVKLLEIVGKDHRSVIERALEDELRWLEIAGQAEKTVQATRQMWAKPNIVGHVGASIFERFGTRAVQEEEKISNQIQRTSIYGTSNFNGALVMKPVVNPDRIELAIVLNGSSDSRTRAYAGPAIILSRAKSRVQVEKKIFIDPSGFSTNNAKVNIRTNSQIQNVQDIRNRQLVENFILRRAYARKDQTESIAMAQNSARLRARFNKQVDDALRSWNKQMTELLKVHFHMRDLDLLNARTWSDEAGAHAQTLFSCRSGMGAYSDPPQISEVSDFHFAVHETALQSVFAGFLGGLNLDAYARKHLQESAPGFLKKALENADSKENEKSRDDWAMRFPKDWPISISIHDGKVGCVVHCSGLEVNKKTYSAVDIIVSYAVDLQEDGIHLLRQDEIEILPPDYDPDSNKRLPASMVSLRRVMGKRLQEAFAPEIVIKEQPIVKNPPADSHFAKVCIKPVFVQAKDGWLQVGMNLYEKE